MQNNPGQPMQAAPQPMVQNGQPMPYQPMANPNKSKKGLIIGLSIGGAVLVAIIVVVLIFVLHDDKVTCSRTRYNGDVVTKVAHFKDGYLDREDDETTYTDPQEAVEECNRAKLAEAIGATRVKCNGNSVKVEDLISTASPYSDTKAEYVEYKTSAGYTCK